jgi:tetratricopeptide (TPR) repeat protein
MQVAENYASGEALQKAWPLLRTAAASQPRDPLLYAKIAEALESAGNTAQAKNAYDLVLEQDPEQVDVLLRLARLLERSGNRSEAAAVRKRAAAILPRLPR